MTTPGAGIGKEKTRCADCGGQLDGALAMDVPDSSRRADGDGRPQILIIARTDGGGDLYLPVRADRHPSGTPGWLWLMSMCPPCLANMASKVPAS